MHPWRGVGLGGGGKEAAWQRLSFSRKMRIFPETSQTGISFCVTARTGFHGQASCEEIGETGNRTVIVALDHAFLKGRVGEEGAGGHGG